MLSVVLRHILIAQMDQLYTHISFYKFADVEEPRKLQMEIKNLASRLGLKGTILIAGEGVNGMLAGAKESIEEFMVEFKKNPLFSDLVFKQNISKTQPFLKLLIKTKKEILTFNEAQIKPHIKTGAYLKPQILKAWLDEGRDLVLVDTRNDFEVQYGTFKNAINPKISKFTEFKKAVDEKFSDLKNKTIVTFCTGGIRCEKASAYMLEKGFKDVWQIEGGILKYLEDTDGSFWEGQCFVFDNRIAVDKKLNEVSSKNKSS